MKRFVLLIGLLLPQISFAEPPFIVTESAIPVEPNTYRVEADIRFAEFQRGRRENDLPVSVRYGLIHHLEIKASAPILYFEEAGNHQGQFGDVRFSTKVLFLKGRDAAPISVAGGMEVKLPTASRNRIANTTGKADTRLSLMATKNMTTKKVGAYKAHFNIAHTYIGNPPHEARFDQEDYSIGVERMSPTPNLSLTGELVGTVNARGFSPNEQWLLSTGASYLLQPRMGIHGAVAFGLSRHAPDFIIRLGMHHLF